MYFPHFWCIFAWFFFFVDVLTPIFLFDPHVVLFSEFHNSFYYCRTILFVKLVFSSLFVIYKADVIVKPVLLLVRQSSVLR